MKKTVITLFVLLSSQAFAGDSRPLDLSPLLTLKTDVGTFGGCGDTCSGDIDYDNYHPYSSVSTRYQGGEDACEIKVKFTVEGRLQASGPPGFPDMGMGLINDTVVLRIEGHNDGDCQDTATDVGTGSAIVSLKPGDPVYLTYDAGAWCRLCCAAGENDRCHMRVVNAELISTCRDSQCQAGDGKITLGCVNARINLGKTTFDTTAGDIWIYTERPSPDLASPRALHYWYGGNAVQIITNTSGLRQVKTLDILADVITNSSYSFQIDLYGTNQIVGFTDGLYWAAGTPEKTWRFENPDAAADVYHRYAISEIEGQVTNQHVYAWDSTHSVWSLAQGNGDNRRYTSQKEEVQTTGNLTNRILTKEVRNAAGVLAFKERMTLTAFPWGLEKTESVLDPDGVALTNRWLYYTENETPTNSYNYGRLKGTVDSRGYWETYEYGDRGICTKQKCQFLLAPYDAPDVQCRVVWTTNYFEEGWHVVREEILGVEVLQKIKTQWGFKTEGHYIMIVPPTGPWYESTNRVVTEIDYVARTGDLQYRRHPDGTMEFYAYTNVGGLRVITHDAGAPDEVFTCITNGTRTIRTEDWRGNLVSEYQTALPFTHIMLQAVSATATDGKGRPTRLEYMDGTWEERAYGCCGLEYLRDREGRITAITYDEFMRPSEKTVDGVTHRYTYDAHGRLVHEERSAAGYAPMPVQSIGYDIAGRRTNQVDAFGYETTFGEYVDEQGFSVQDTRYPDGGRRVIKRYPDGKLYSVTGTAVAPLQYAYGAASNHTWVLEIKLDAAGGTQEWAKTWTDMAGRRVRVDYADGSCEHFDYNTQNQLIRQVNRDGEARLFTYNGMGQAEYAVLDMNTNGVIDFAGEDRIEKTTGQWVFSHGTDCWQTVSYVWPSNQLDVAEMAAMREVSSDGRSVWESHHGLTNQTYVSFGGAGERLETVMAPDGTYALSLSATGRVMSRSFHATNGGLITVESYAYDAYGRLTTLTDGRTKVTSNQYDHADRLTRRTVWDADPATPPAIEQFQYDHAGRVLVKTLPNGHTISNWYSPAGWLLEVRGATYPVAYEYDAQGRLTTLTTWQDANLPASAQTTRWLLDPCTGVQTARISALQTTNHYTWSAAGKPRSRTAATGNTITYAYNPAGEPIEIAYSDGTDPEALAYDRLGRLVSLTDALGVQTVGYAAGNQQVSEIYTEGALTGLGVTRAYDAYGRLAALSAVAQETSTVTYAYDAAARLAGIGYGGVTATYAYLPYSQTLSSNLVYAQEGTGLAAIAEDYDSSGRLKVLQAFVGNTTLLARTYAYDEMGQLAQCMLEDGCHWRYQYDRQGQLISATNHWDSGQPVPGQQFAYTYDDIGNRMETVLNGFASQYTANDLNQYTERTVPGAVEMMGWGPTAAYITVNNQPVTRATNGYFYKALFITNASVPVYHPVWVSSVEKNAGVEGLDIVSVETGRIYVAQTPEHFQYDAEGNLLENGRWQFTWDAAGRLVACETTTNAMQAGTPRICTHYRYDVLGRLVQQIEYADYNQDLAAYESTNTATFLYDGWKIIAELRQGHITHAYGWGNDLGGGATAANGIRGLVFLAISNHLLAPVMSGNGSVEALVDLASGTLAAQYAYAPFGRTLQAVGELAQSNPMRFSTKLLDAMYGLYNFGFRFYDPSLGRWLTPDPLGENAGLNIYSYVGNEPLRHMDPYGLATKCCAGVNYDTASHCCRKDQVFAKDKREYYADYCINKPGLLPKHGWIEVGDSSIGFYPPYVAGDGSLIKTYNGGNAVFFFQGHYQSPENTDYTKLVNSQQYGPDSKKCTSFYLSPCDYDIEKARQCIFSTSPNPYNLAMHNCLTWAQNQLGSCAEKSLYAPLPNIWDPRAL